MGARKIAAGVRDKKFSASEVFEDCLKRAEDREGELSALITVTAEAGRARAKQIDELVAKGENPGLLAGVPVVLKDNICTHGIRTTAGSRALDNWSPPYDATAWALLAGEGAVLLGKGNMDEFGAGVSGKSAFAATANPRDSTKEAGGSSGGSAAAVAAGYVPVSLGSDTGGSIRIPASYCGIYGLKPTYGLVSRNGLASLASSLDQIGPFARDVEDMALVMRILTRHDPKDSTSVSKNEIDFTKRTDTLKGRRLAVVKEYMALPVDQRVAEAMKRTMSLFEESGAEVVEISLPTTARHAMACYYMIMTAEAHTSFARFDGVRFGRAAEGSSSARDMFEAVRSEGFGANVKSRIITGTYLAAPGPYEEYYEAATRVRALIAEEFNKAFAGGIDCILQPVTPSLPRGLSENTARGHELVYTMPANLAGLPGFSFPAGHADSGLQIIGPRWSDGELLDIGSELEKIFGAPKIAAGPGDR
jgi:aspartyl-tRNA(Asn)/glutamyl-tRNA(Gln) amidotransferase subunit A